MTNSPQSCSAESESAALRTALKHLLSAALPAQLAERSGCVLGREYGQLLDQAIHDAKAAIK